MVKKKNRNDQRVTPASSTPEANARRSFLLGALATGAVWGVFFTWLWPRMLYHNKGGDIVAGWQYLWADWSAHFTYAAHFAYRPMADWFTDHPLFAGAKFTYPFVMDAISGILMKAGVDAVPAFVVPSMGATAAFLVFFYLFAYRVTRQGGGSFWAITFFLTGGSCLFLWYYFPELVQTLGLPERHDDKIIGWKNVIISELVPQRAFLLGLPVTLAVTYYLLSWSDRGFERVRAWQLALLGLLAALLLTIHVHSYICLVIFSAVLLASRIAQFRFFLVYGGSAAALSLAIYLWMFHGAVDGGFFAWHPGWLANPASYDRNFVLFWLLNWGLFLPAALFAAYRTRLFFHPVTISGLVIFAVGNLVLFQPWDWDNEKILTWSHLFLSIPLGAYVARLFSGRQILKQIGGGVLAVALMIGGLYEMGFIIGYSDEGELSRPVSERGTIPRQKQEFTMFSFADLKLAADFRAISAPTDTVMAADQVTHFINTNTGRRILLGYRGWMWTYGIDYGERERDMKTAYAGNGAELPIVEKYDIRFVVIGPEELTNFQANETYYQVTYPLVLENANYRIYQVSE